MKLFRSPLTWLIVMSLILGACTTPAPTTSSAPADTSASAPAADTSTSTDSSTDPLETEWQFKQVDVDGQAICGLKPDGNGNHTIGILCVGGGTYDMSSMGLVLVGTAIGGYYVPQSIWAALAAAGGEIIIVAGGVILFAAVVAVTAVAAQASYEIKPCVPKDQLAAYQLSSGDPHPRVCPELLPREQLPPQDPNHHGDHDDVPSNPEAQKRWQNARDRFGNWNEVDWHNKPTQQGQVRCGGMYMNGLLFRVSIFIATKVVEGGNTYGDYVSYDVYGNQVTSFGNARWQGDFLKVPNNLQAAYGQQVRVETMNCNDLTMMNLTVPPVPAVAP